MAYEDWMPEFQDVWENTPGTSELEGTAREEAEYFFEEGFMHYTGEVSHTDTDFARESFFDLIGYDDEYFDWEGWREAMGYDLSRNRRRKPRFVLYRGWGDIQHAIRRRSILRRSWRPRLSVSH